MPNKCSLPDLGKLQALAFSILDKGVDMLKFLTNTNQPIKLYVFKVYLVGLLVGIPISFF
jgi:hypothetical protein